MRKCPKLCAQINCCNVNFGAQFAKFPHGLLNIITGGRRNDFQSGGAWPLTSGIPSGTNCET